MVSPAPMRAWAVACALLVVTTMASAGVADAGVAAHTPPGEDEHPSQYNIGDTSIFAANEHGGRVTVVFVNHEMWRQKLVQNLLCSWRRIGFDAYVFIAVDEDAFHALDAAQPGKVHFYAPWWNGVGGHLLRATNEKTRDYVGFIHKRTRFVEALLLSTQLTVVMCDVDTVWTRDFFADGTVPLDEPSTQRCDGFVVNSAHRGGLGPPAVEPLGGFIVAKNNKRMHMWYRVWTALEHCLQSKEQPAMHTALHVLNARFARQFHMDRDLGSRNVSDSELVLCVLHDAYFPTGFHLDGTYLTEDYADGRAIALAHASITDKSAKQVWFERHGMWLVQPEDPTRCVSPEAVKLNTSRDGIDDTHRHRSGLKRAHIAHHSDISQIQGSTTNCTALMLSSLPALRAQVDEAFATLRHSYVFSDYPSLNVNELWHIMVVVFVAGALFLLRRYGVLLPGKARRA